MAHIFAASPASPRANPELSPEERGAYENLILLCSVCHTVVDKAPDDFPDDIMRAWKAERTERLSALFGATRLSDRKEVRSRIEPLMAENKHVLDEYGPNTERRFDVESNSREIWERKVLTRILPNNRRILAWLDANREKLTEVEKSTVEAFRHHLDDLAARHLEGITGGRQYPQGMLTIMEAN